MCYGLEDGRLQQLRRHLAYLKLAAAAKQLPAALKAAQKIKPGYTQFLHNLLDGGTSTPRGPSRRRGHRRDLSTGRSLQRSLRLGHGVHGSLMHSSGNRFVGAHEHVRELLAAI